MEPSPRCPHCLAALRSSSERDGGDPGRQDAGRTSLRCTECDRAYPLIDGIVRFVERKELGPQNRRHALLNDLLSYVYTPAVRLMFVPCGGEARARAEFMDHLGLDEAASRPPGTDTLSGEQNDRRDRAVGAGALAAGPAVLEVGVGTGDNFPELARRVPRARLWGIDIAPRMLRRCRRNLRRRGRRATLYQAQAERLPFGDDSFDVVYHLGAINFFDDQRRAIEEMARVARPGSKVVLADENERALRVLDRLGLQIFIGRREEVHPPVEQVPKTVTDVVVETIWRGYGYLIQFRVPDGDSDGR